MKQLTFNFCGVDAVTDLDLIVNDIKKPIIPEVSESTQDVPGMVGKIFLGNSYGQKVFEIEITIKAKDSEELTVKLQELSELVMSFGDEEYPMIFSNDPEYTYYGHFSSVSKPERITQNSSWRKATLTFSCSDPKGYGAYTTNDMVTNPVSLLPAGNSDTYPIFTCIPKKDVQKIVVSDEDGNYVFLGAGVDDETGSLVQDLEPLVFSDAANDLSSWTNVTSPTFIVDYGVVRGSYGTSADSIHVSSYGANAFEKWHGPLIQKWFPGSYQDYRIRARMMNLQNYTRAQGKIELYLLNSNGERIGKLALKDNSNSREVYAQVQMGTQGGKYIYNDLGKVTKGKTTVGKVLKVKNGTQTVVTKVKGKADKKTTVQKWRTIKLDQDLDKNIFTNFYGYIELQKIGKKYRIEIMKMTLDSNPGWKKPLVITWTDSSNKYSNEAVAGVALYCAKNDITEDTADPPFNYDENTVKLTDLKVWNIINGGNDSTKPQTIARKGDEIKINSEDHMVYKNGAYFMDKFYIGSQFLQMKGGVYKTFAFEPSLKDADWYVEYTPTTS